MLSLYGRIVMESIDFFCLSSPRLTVLLAVILMLFAALAMAEPPTPQEFIESDGLVLTLSDKWLQPNPNLKKFSRPSNNHSIDETAEEKPANIDCGVDSSPTDKFIPNGFAGECSFNYHY